MNIAWKNLIPERRCRGFDGLGPRWHRFLNGMIAAVATLAVAADARAGAIYAWGDNQYGQIGDGTDGTERDSPAPVPGLGGGVTAVAVGGSHSLAVQNGSVYAWGLNTSGQLGAGAAPQIDSPVAVTGLSSVTAIAAGYTSSLALQNGGVYIWGNDGTAQHYSPVPVTGLTSGVTLIASGNDDSLAVQYGGVYAWGGNGVGQIGNGTTGGPQITPVAVTGLSSGVTAIAAGQSFSLAVQNGGVYAWGYNNFGQLGDGTTSNRNTPVAVTGLPGGVSSIAAGRDHSLAVIDGYVYAWGGNYSGELGDGTTNESNTPELIDPVDVCDIIAVAAGQDSSYALSSDGSLWVWGDDLFGQMGLDVETDDYLTPQHLLPPDGYIFTSISASSEGDHAVALLSAVPEPSAFALAGIGLVSVLVCVRRRRRALVEPARRRAFSILSLQPRRACVQRSAAGIFCRQCSGGTRHG